MGLAYVFFGILVVTTFYAKICSGVVRSCCRLPRGAFLAHKMQSSTALNRATPKASSQIRRQTENIIIFHFFFL